MHECVKNVGYVILLLANYSSDLSVATDHNALSGTDPEIEINQGGWLA